MRSARQGEPDTNGESVRWLNGAGAMAPDETKLVPVSAVAPAVVVQPPRARRVRFMSWVFAVALLLGVSAFVAQSTQQWQFATLLARVRPEWLLLGALLQLGTYYGEARIWQCSLERARVYEPLRHYIGLSLAKLFLDHTVPTGGLSGTLLLVRALDRRNVPRAASMAAVVVMLVSHYFAHGIGLICALGLVLWHGDFTLYLLLPSLVFAALAIGLPSALLSTSGGQGLPPWVKRVPLLRSALTALAEASPEVSRDRKLIAHCTALQLSVLLLDALTLWAMLLSLGLSVNPVPVCASFMLSTLARILGIVPGGLGVFEAVSVATLSAVGVPVAAGLAATLLFRGFSFWLPLIPATVFAHRETRED
jgi:Mg2+-importing ATPase